LGFAIRMLKLRQKHDEAPGRWALRGLVLPGQAVRRIRDSNP
jgi:hypothetical protein